MRASHTSAAEPYADTELACLAGAKAALYRWAATVATRDVDQVLALYAPDAILVPTCRTRYGTATTAVATTSTTSWPMMGWCVTSRYSRNG